MRKIDYLGKCYTRKGHYDMKTTRQKCTAQENVQLVEPITVWKQLVKNDVSCQMSTSKHQNEYIIRDAVSFEHTFGGNWVFH